MIKRMLCATTALALLAGCGGRSEERTEEASRDTRVFDTQEAPPRPEEGSTTDMAAPMTPPPPVAAGASRAQMDASAGGPSIAPTAVPGVAFNYRYAFRLPADRISAVQEAHAAACEKLGAARCRITGMRYRLVGERDIEAMLAFKLAPVIARDFGKNGVEGVARADGMLVDSEITGVEVGAAIRGATRTIAQLQEDLARTEEQLARAGRGERVELTYQAQQLRERIRAQRQSREADEESLATTPMVFQYGSGDLVPGFETRAPFRRALAEAGDNLVSGAGIILLLLASLAPWALLLGSLWWIARRFGLLRWDRPASAAEPA